MRKLLSVLLTVILGLSLFGCTSPISDVPTTKEVAAAKTKYLEELADKATMDSGTGFVALPTGAVYTDDSSTGEGYFYVTYSDIPTIIGNICRKRNVKVTQPPRVQTRGLESDNTLIGFYFHYEEN